MMVRSIQMCIEERTGMQTTTRLLRINSGRRPSLGHSKGLSKLHLTSEAPHVLTIIPSVVKITTSMGIVASVIRVYSSTIVAITRVVTSSIWSTIKHWRRSTIDFRTEGIPVVAAMVRRAIMKSQVTERVFLLGVMVYQTAVLYVKGSSKSLSSQSVATTSVIHVRSPTMRVTGTASCVALLRTVYSM